MINQPHANVLISAYPCPCPPSPLPTGRKPDVYLQKLPPQLASLLKDSLEKNGHGKSITGLNDRTRVRKICQNGDVDPLAAYTVAMAWGGQDLRRPRQGLSNFEKSLSNGSRVPLEDLLKALRTSKQGRDDDFEMAKIAAESIQGLGISFYTKLLYFFRPRPDAYILDKWTAMASNLLFVPQPVRLEKPDAKGHCSPKRGKNETTALEYERFCQEVDKLPGFLWPGSTVSGDVAEMAMFGVPLVAGDKSKLWRKRIEREFPPPKKDKKAEIVKSKIETSRHSFLKQLLTVHQGALDNGRNLPRGIFLIPKPALKSAANIQGARWVYDPADAHVRVFKHFTSPATRQAYEEDLSHAAALQRLAEKNRWEFVALKGKKPGVDPESPGIGFQLSGKTRATKERCHNLATECVKAMEILYASIP